MLTKRIIPCLDVKEGRVVKGTNFVGLRDAGDPVERAAAYDVEGADELVFLDITATFEERKAMLDVIRKTAGKVFMPLTVGGGINKIEDVGVMLNAGADKISINSSALRNPALISEIAGNFGNQVCVVAIDAKLEDDGKWHCYVKGGHERTNRELFEWAHEAQERGAGEILFTSMNHDGVKQGFACDTLRKMHEELSIPIIASGGCGTMEHFAEVFDYGMADAALAASVFHFNEISIKELKNYLSDRNINVRRI